MHLADTFIQSDLQCIQAIIFFYQYDYSDVLLDIVVGVAVALVKRFRTHRRGKRAGVLVKLRQRGLRMPLPSIHLANLRSLPNKTDELLLLSRINKDFSNSAALCFTETWLNDAIPNTALHLLNVQLIRADRDAESTGNADAVLKNQHLDRPGTYVWILFVDFSSAFNTIIPVTLQNKLTQLSVPTSICQWIPSFLTDRQQLVRLGKFSSSTRTISTGAPQGCVLSPLLFSLYTNECTSKDPSVKLLKFADNTTVIGLIQDGDESAYRQEVKGIVHFEIKMWYLSAYPKGIQDVGVFFSSVDPILIFLGQTVLVCQSYNGRYRSLSL